MSERGAAVRRYLGSRKNLAGMAGALVGVGAHVAGVVGDVWPLVAAGLYGAGALMAPGDPRPEDAKLTDALRGDAEELLAHARSNERRLPDGAVPAIRRMLSVLRLVLDRLDDVSEKPEVRAAVPDWLATVAEMIRNDLPLCIDTFLSRSAASSRERTAAELAVQLDLIAAAVDKLADAVPDVHADRAGDLTRLLLERYGETG